MTQSKQRERASTRAADTQRLSCPHCGGSKLDARRVLEHLPCGNVFFEPVDGELSDYCRKCGESTTDDSTTHRGTVVRCQTCRRAADAKASGSE